MLTRILAGVLVALTALVSGCTANAGSAFAEQYGAYLDTVPEVESQQVRGNNDLPGVGSADTQVVLKPDLTAEQVAGVFAKLASHRVDQKVSEHHLSVRFVTPNGSGDDAVVSVYATVDKNPATLSKADAREQVDRIVDFAAQDPGLTDYSTFVNTVHVTTDDDPFATAQRVLDFLPRQPEGLMNVMVSSGPGSIWLFNDSSLDELRPITKVLSVLPDDVEPKLWRASIQNPSREAVFEIVLPPDTSDEVVGKLERVAELNAIAVKVTVAR